MANTFFKHGRVSNYMLQTVWLQSLQHPSVDMCSSILIFSISAGGYLIVYSAWRLALAHLSTANKIKGKLKNITPVAVTRSAQHMELAILFKSYIY